MLDTAVPYQATQLRSDPLDPRQSLDIPEQTQPRRSSYAGEDEQSHILADPIEYAPPVIVFFSFMNDRSKQWAMEHQVVRNLRKSVPQGTTIARYHAPMRFAWDFGEHLTHAWAVAKSLQVDDRVIGPLFEAVHDRKIHDLEGVRAVFNECGVPPDMFLKEWGKEWVMGEKKAMDDAVAHVDLDEVPGILVKGKYMVKLDALKDSSADGVIKLVKGLLARE